MKCILHSAKHNNIREKDDFFKTWKELKHGKIQEYWWSRPPEERKEYEQDYIEGDLAYIFEQLYKIKSVTLNDSFLMILRDDGDIDITIDDDYTE